MRIALAFAAASAAILAGLGLFVYLRFESRLDDTINSNLRTRAAAVGRGLKRDGVPGRDDAGPIVEQEESFGQVLSTAGRVLAPRSGPATRPFIGRASVTHARRAPTFVDDAHVAISNERVRLFAEPAATDRGRRVIVVTGTPLDDRDDSLASLRRLLIVGGLAALAIASVVGYVAVAAALRPVEAMRRRAAEISTAEAGERLPVGEARDELSRLGTTLNAMLERIQAALARERRFLDDASHELRTPLALQRVELETAMRYSSDPAELRAAIASAIEEVDRLNTLADDLLATRADAGDRAAQERTVEVAPLCEDVARRFRPRAAEEGRSVVVDADGVGAVRCDPDRIERALSNLVDNALRHGDGEIELRAQRADARVELHVRDRGGGFPPDFVAHAFERFTRAEGRGGAGLGLAIVERIARAHGGTAKAANHPGGGADVWIELPARTEPRSA